MTTPKRIQLDVSSLFHGREEEMGLTRVNNELWMRFPNHLSPVVKTQAQHEQLRTFAFPALEEAEVEQLKKLDQLFDPFFQQREIQSKTVEIETERGVVVEIEFQTHEDVAVFLRDFRDKKSNFMFPNVKTASIKM